MSTQGGVEAAQGRLLEALRSGAWERVPEQAEAYGAAVRADERRRTLDDVTASIEKLFEDHGAERPAAEWRDRTLGAIERLR